DLGDVDDADDDRLGDGADADRELAATGVRLLARAEGLRVQNARARQRRGGARADADPGHHHRAEHGTAAGLVAAQGRDVRAAARHQDASAMARRASSVPARAAASASASMRTAAAWAASASRRSPSWRSAASLWAASGPRSSGSRSGASRTSAWYTLSSPSSSLGSVRVKNPSTNPPCKKPRR